MKKLNLTLISFVIVILAISSPNKMHMLCKNHIYFLIRGRVLVAKFLGLSNNYEIKYKDENNLFLLSRSYPHPFNIKPRLLEEKFRFQSFVVIYSVIHTLSFRISLIYKSRAMGKQV